MELFKLADMTKGWFVGDFTPSVFSTSEAEVAVKRYKAGETEEAHFHKVATEITLVLDGTVEMCGRRINAGEIVKLAPGEITPFQAVTDVTTVVVKLPSIKGDKHAA